MWLRNVRNIPDPPAEPKPVRELIEQESLPDVGGERKQQEEAEEPPKQPKGKKRV